jgi:hypothetical protein
MGHGPVEIDLAIDAPGDLGSNAVISASPDALAHT